MIDYPLIISLWSGYTRIKSGQRQRSRSSSSKEERVVLYALASAADHFQENPFIVRISRCHGLHMICPVVFM
jgi:hypothetical protein